jgi:hypothetical protein
MGAVAIVYQDKCGPLGPDGQSFMKMIDAMIKPTSDVMNDTAAALLTANTNKMNYDKEHGDKSWCGKMAEVLAK